MQYLILKYTKWILYSNHSGHMSDIDSVFFIKSLKKQIKMSRTTYRELAMQLKMSEAGVKKIFTKQDISFGRALQICRTLGLDISDILNESSENMLREQSLTEKQQNFFIEHPSYFHFFMQLGYEQIPLEQIQKKYNLNDKSVFKYLKKFDDLGLIKLHKNNSFTLVDGAVLRLKTSGTPMEKLKFQATEDLLNSIESSKNGFLGGAILYLSRLEMDNLKTDLEDLSNRYVKVAQSNRAKRKKNLKMNDYDVYTMMYMYSPQTLFGRINNLD